MSQHVRMHWKRKLRSPTSSLDHSQEHNGNHAAHLLVRFALACVLPRSADQPLSRSDTPVLDKLSWAHSLYDHGDCAMRQRPRGVGAGAGPNLADASQPIALREFSPSLKVWADQPWSFGAVTSRPSFESSLRAISRISPNARKMRRRLMALAGATDRRSTVRTGIIVRRLMGGNRMKHGEHGVF
jgi:hypothetical protein